MTADGGCGVSWSYHYLRYCGTGKGNYIILQRQGKGEGSYAWEQIVDSHLCLKLGGHCLGGYYQLCCCCSTTSAL